MESGRVYGPPGGPQTLHCGPDSCFWLQQPLQPLAPGYRRVCAALTKVGMPTCSVCLWVRKLVFPRGPSMRLGCSPCPRGGHVSCGRHSSITQPPLLSHRGSQRVTMSQRHHRKRPSGVHSPVVSTLALGQRAHGPSARAFPCGSGARWQKGLHIG